MAAHPLRNQAGGGFETILTGTCEAYSEGDYMKTDVLNLNYRAIQHTGRRGIRWAAVDTVLGGMGGLLFGGLFGTFRILVHHDPSQIILSAGYFALCGATAGAVIGTFAAMVETEESPGPEYSLPDFAKPVWIPTESIRNMICPRDWQPRITAFEANRRRRETRASQNPSWN